MVLNVASILARRFIVPMMILAALLAGIAATSSANATTKQIAWKDLVPDLPPLVDPLDALEFEQRFELESILWVRQLSEVERRERADIVEEAERYEREFQKRGMPVDKLIADYAAWSKKAEARQRIMNETLNGKTVELQGYLLPIEFSDEGVTEFLVVPYVGACVHVPAPPANQIVFARLPEKLKVEDLFTAAKITGELRTQMNEKNLNLSDGSAPVAVGYQLDVKKVELVKE